MTLEWNEEQTRFLIDERKTACNKNFLSLTRAYYTTKAYKEGNPAPSAGAQLPSVVTLSSPNTLKRSQPSKIPRPISHSQVSSSARTASKTPRAIPPPNISRPTTPTARPSSRPITPSFSQSAETINIFINYNEPDQE
ncbi:unnamed protein product [Rhizophagus irregularis]|nr:unnamed protein product [Rhizophagus irregularis]